MREAADPRKAEIHLRFFKTGKGEYGEGDRFIGITMPVQRAIAAEFRDLAIADAEKLLRSGIHEERMAALLILIHRYRQGDDGLRELIFRLYLDSTAYINNWDLVDASAEHIVGRHLLETGKAPDILFERARSGLLWDRRVAMLACFHYIKKKQFAVPRAVAELLLHDTHDLMHKAVGWMLREIGKRDLETELAFLRAHYHGMPRTMLRYAIEKFPEDLRQRFLAGTE